MDLFIDFETYSGVDLKKVGAYRYAADPGFKIICVSYREGYAGETQTLWLNGQDLPAPLVRLIDQAQFVVAHNDFERVVLKELSKRGKLAGVNPDGMAYVDTMHLAAYAGLPLSLDGASEALGIGRKLAAGKNWIAAINRHKGDLTFMTDLDRAEFAAYNRQDVDLCAELYERLQPLYSALYMDRRVEKLDREINDRGINFSEVLCQAAMEVQKRYEKYRDAELEKLFPGKNMRSPKQVKEILSEIAGVEITSLDKRGVDALKEAHGFNPGFNGVLDTYQDVSKNSISKYQTCWNAAIYPYCLLRGLFQYYGASHTGRWAGRLVQLQNLPRITVDDVDALRLELEPVEADGTHEALLARYDRFVEKYGMKVPAMLSNLLRTVFIPRGGYKFCIVDFSAIEARVLAWLAQERWRLDVFSTTGKIYETSAAAIFGKSVDECGKGTPYRAKGKVAELAFGYGGGVGAFRRMAGQELASMTDEQVLKIVHQWRTKSPRITAFWRDLERGFRAALTTTQRIEVRRNLNILRQKEWVAIYLPSGRPIYYYKPGEAPDGSLYYYGQNQVTKQFERVKLYGGKLTENVVQATARDLLAAALLRFDERGYHPVMHVHDEGVFEVPEVDEHSFEYFKRLFAMTPSWAAGLPCDADGGFGKYYSK
jgi:DNA polymerase